MSTITSAVGERVRFLRLQHRLTQEELSERADLHNTYISQIECGEKNPSIVSLDKILTAMNVTYAEFFEPIDLTKAQRSVAAQCYELINRKSPAQQSRILRILQELDAMTK